MAQQQETKQPQELKIFFPPELRGGVYSNLMYIGHTREEFILDFLMVRPPEGSVTARVIMSPGHIKRTIIALQQNLKKYEDNFGKITEAPEPQGKGKIGFHVPES
jgi:hypothetical protein